MANRQLNDRIMIVDDSQTNIDILQRHLSKSGYVNYVITTEGCEVIELAGKELPGIDGLEATRQLKQNPQTDDIPVWALTAHAMTGDGHKALEAGCSAYLTKPIDGKEFSNLLREYLIENTIIGGGPCKSS